MYRSVYDTQIHLDQVDEVNRQTADHPRFDAHVLLLQASAA